MTYQQVEFIAYYMGKGDRNINTYCSYLNKLEEQFSCNIDAEYGNDRCVSIDAQLQSKYDEYRNTNPKMYNRLKQIRQALKKYCEFRNSIESLSVTNSGVKHNNEHKMSFEKEKKRDLDYATDVALNSILYGPPGTGKTYHSVIYAVAIIENRKVDTVAKEKYEDVLKRFNNYKAQGRIEFSTFHQAYGYEDFIEGIRPVIVEEDNQNDKGNIQYFVRPGIFKKN